MTVEAAGSAKDGAPTAWLQNRFDAHQRQEYAKRATPFADVMTTLTDLKQQKENAMPLSLEQFDERVARANKSMDRLEGMVDSGAERQAVEDMRKEISALFEEQRRDIQMQQMPSVMQAGGGEGTSTAARAAREQAGAAKNAQDEQRQQILRQAEQERQRGNDRDGAER